LQHWGVLRLKLFVYKIVLGFLGFFLILFFLEFTWFYFVLQKGQKSESADVIAVFGGAHARTVKGYGLANEGFAPFLIISPSSEKGITRLDKTYRLKDSYQYLIEDRSETTFQNALLVSELTPMLQKSEGFRAKATRAPL
jgi:hypothetical protein